MPTEIWLTDGVAKGTANAAQSLSSAIDVSRQDVLDLVLYIAGVEGTMTTFTVSIITGMSLDSEEGWVTLGSFANNLVTGSPELKRFVGPLRYIRWKVTGFQGGTAVFFSVRGMARSS